MHPESQSLESSFEPDVLERGELSDAMARDPVIDDFNAFFERLSSIDSLQWSSSEEGGAAAATDAGAPQAPARPAPAQPPRPAVRPTPQAHATGATRPRMTVLRSERDLAGPLPPAAANSGARRAERHRLREAARLLKMTLIGLMLFALGLGAGWLALSVPGHFEDVMPSVTRLMERTRAIAANAPATPSDATAKVGAADTAQRLRVVEPAAGAAKAAAKPAQAPAIAKAAPATAATAKGAATATPQTAARIEKDIQLPSAQAGANEPVAADDSDAAAPAEAGADARPQFALQVGACTSFACVEAYRHLLLGSVGSHSIKVVSQPRGEGQSPVQRIRVQPLERADAERLKISLTAQDKRFGDAYLIALH